MVSQASCAVCAGLWVVDVARLLDYGQGEWRQDQVKAW